MFDEKAQILREVLEKWERYYLRILKKIFGHRQGGSIEEVFQSVSLELIERKEYFYERKPYFLTIKYLIKDRGETERDRVSRRQNTETVIEDDVHTIGVREIINYDNPQNRVEREELFKHLFNCIDELDYPDKELFILGIINDFKYKDLAKIYNLRIENVKIKIFRAKLRIKKCIKKNYE